MWFRRMRGILLEQAESGLSSDDSFEETSARYRAVEPERWLQRHPEAGSSWPSWPEASYQAAVIWSRVDSIIIKKPPKTELYEPRQTRPDRSSEETGRGPGRVVRRGFENNYLTEMCSGSEAGSYLRRIDFWVTQL